MKTLDEIYSEMLREYSEKTGLAVVEGGDMSVRMYAAAAQIHSLWVQADFLSRQTFPQTAQGEYLDRHAAMRGLERGLAVCAEGEIKFYADQASQQALEVPEGTVCVTSSGVEVQTTQAAEIAAGQLYCTAPARAVEPGSGGNIPAGSIVDFVYAPVGVSGCVNLEAFHGGTDEETDGSLRERVLSSYKKLPNGANAAYYETVALAVEQVGAVAVLPKARGVGTVDIILAAEDGVPSEELLEQVRAALEEKREICVDVSVYAPETVSVDVTVELEADSGSDFDAVAAEVEKRLGEYFTGRLLGQDILRAKLGSLIYGSGGVRNYILSQPAADIAVEQGQLPVIGTVTITAKSA